LQTADLNFEYPEELVATKALPRGQARILSISRDQDVFKEISWNNLMGLFQPGDTVVFNDSQVLWARLVIEKPSGKEGEIFFLKTLSSQTHWEVLSKGMNFKEGKEIVLPGDVKATVVRAGRTSEIKIQKALDLKKYFDQYGHVPLPPYIMNLRHNDEDDKADRERYQNVWAKEWGSVAAPTAGLHFSKEHLEALKKRGVKVAYVTLHVGAGTFLPIDTGDLKDFQIHSEVINVPAETCDGILKTQAAGKKVWAVGTTVLRALETAAHASTKTAGPLRLVTPFYGETKLFVTPGYRFLVVDGLLTNFHQPQSSLLALASAFATRNPATSKSDEKKAVDKLLRAYKFAIDKKFRLFSYGDLTVIS
jgi:S-adenosylmethionine:tRNA ribosyltransferase-isomerase